MESGGVVCFGGCITQYTDFRGVALVYDTYRDSSVGGAGEKCLTTTFGDSEHVAANTDFVVFNGLFDCLSFDDTLLWVYTASRPHGYFDKNHLVCKVLDWFGYIGDNCEVVCKWM